MTAARLASRFADDPEQLAMLDRLLATRNRIARDPQVAIPVISKAFSSLAYVDHLLDGREPTEEELVVDLTRLDCMTLLEYVETIRRSGNRADFLRNLARVRYLGGAVDYRRRRHFFSSWVDERDALAEDVTRDCGGRATQSVTKTLNLKADGGAYVPGIPASERTISYIPTDALSDTTIASLCDGDYIGIYSPLDGLDVSHVGIFTRDGDEPMLRHASSVRRYRRVVDHPFIDYLHGVHSEGGAARPGILVYRARA